MSDFRLLIGGTAFEGSFELSAAPLTVAAIRRQLPFSGRVIHVRWSGEAIWVPMGATDFGVGPENATSYPSPGQILFHPAGASETELLIAYGPVRFASKAGQLAGNHFATITRDLGQLAALGRQTLQTGAMDLRIALV